MEKMSLTAGACHRLVIILLLMTECKAVIGGPFILLDGGSSTLNSTISPPPQKLNDSGISTFVLHSESLNTNLGQNQTLNLGFQESTYPSTRFSNISLATTGSPTSNNDTQKEESFSKETDDEDDSDILDVKPNSTSNRNSQSTSLLSISATNSTLENQVNLYNKNNSSENLTDPNTCYPLPDGTWPKITKAEPMRPELWKKYNVTGWLKTYPGAQNKKVHDLARENGIYNFDCRVTQSCHVGQIGHPVPGPLYYPLLCLENYSKFQTAMIKAAGFASHMIQTTASQLAIDLYEYGDHGAHLWFSLAKAFNILLIVTATIAAATMWFLTTGASTVMSAMMIAGAMALGSAATNIAGEQALDARKSDAFSRWSDYATMIAQWQETIQQNANNQTEAILNAGISTEEGLLGTFQDGKYLYDIQEKSTTDIEELLTRMMTARMVSHILLMKKAFVTVDSDECNKGGPNGAFKLEDGWLSYCTKEKGSMRNIIYNHGGKAGNKFYNGQAIIKKYNLTVEYITQQSINCQNKYGEFSHDPYSKGKKFPENMEADCLFNLPVCYVSENKHIRKYKRKHNTVKACKHVAHLPI